MWSRNSPLTACYNGSHGERAPGGVELKIHLDTDIGGDVDDLCALAMLLTWPDVEITGITTVAEEGGRRAAFVYEVLRRAGREEIPVAAGADVSDGYYRYPQLDYPSDERNWGGKIEPRPSPPGDALRLMEQSVAKDAALIAIGPLTNFKLLDSVHANILSDAEIYVMGGYIFDIPDGFPQWRREDDWNVQVDIASARHVLERADPTLIPLTMSTQTSVSHSALSHLNAAGPLGELVARQLAYFAEAEEMAEKYGKHHDGLPDDLINFLHDPLACAIACGWREGVKIESVPLRLEERASYLYELVDDTGSPTRVVTAIDGQAFDRYWLDVMCS